MNIIYETKKSIASLFLKISTCLVVREWRIRCIHFLIPDEENNYLNFTCILVAICENQLCLFTSRQIKFDAEFCWRK